MGRAKSNRHSVPTKSKLKKDPGIPKLPDLKVKKAVQQRHTSASAAGPSKQDSDSIMAAEPTLASLAAEACTPAPADIGDPSSSTSGEKTKEQIRRHYVRTLYKVIDESDIVILVLDARDPEGCRSRLVEEEVRRRESEGKKLVFVLNKIDLVPKDNAQAWLKYLRHTTPALPFLSPSSAQHQRSNISSATAPALLRLLKAYKHKSTSVTIGVVGYPNVGKSSLINSLKRSKVCAVAAQPGHTKDLQSVQLERGMRIVDSPGVIFDTDEEEEQKKGSVLLRNVVKVEDVPDPIAVVEEILRRTSPETIQKIYPLPAYTSVLEFLTMLALTRGRLLRGGTPDVLAAARMVLTDWNQQKIPYMSEPPSVHPSQAPSSAPGAENVGQAQIVTEMSKPFELEGLFTAADSGAFSGKPAQEGDEMQLDEDGEEVFYDAMEEYVEEADTSVHSLKRPRSPTPEAQSSMDNDDLKKPSHLQRQPKRQRKNKDVPGYNDPLDDHILQRMGKSNPLNRRALKKERKRERKRMRASGDGGGMDVDGEELQFTFMA